MEYQLNRAWAEVDLDSIAHNAREIRKITDRRSEIMGVVKADAYGHGVMEVTRTLLDNGVTRLAVATLDEAIQLRNQGIQAPVLILSHTDFVRAHEVAAFGITQAVFSRDLATALSDAAVKLKKDVKIHIKIDTGMTRIGFIPGLDAAEEIAEISRLPGIVVEGIFTHFASADERDRSYTNMQFERFMDMCGQLEKLGVHIPVKHVCNSAGIMEYPEMHLDMVRPGIILYGLYPSGEVDKARLSLRPAMTFKAHVTLVKDVKKDTCISYGRIFTTPRDSRIATIPVGYADGYTRLLSGKGKVLIHGEAAPVVGRICMDQCMLDVTDLSSEVCAGDEAVLFGRQKDAQISADDVAAQIGTISYEVVCQVGKRVPRAYLQSGKIVKTLNYLI